jgi:hypothetical protein
MSDLAQCVKGAVVFFNGVAIGQSSPGAPNGHHDRDADQHDQEQCAHQGDPLMASRLMFERDYPSSPRNRPAAIRDLDQFPAVGSSNLRSG